MNFTLTIDANPRLINAIELLAGAIAGNPGKQMPQQKGETKAQESIKKPEPKNQPEAAETPESETPEPPEGPAKDTAKDTAKDIPEKGNPKSPKTNIAPEDIRAVAATKEREKIKALLDKYNYKNISSIAEADRVGFMEELRGL